MDETAVSLWTDAIRRMLARIDDTARRVTEGFPNFADPQTGEWTTSPQGTGRGALGRRAVARPQGDGRGALRGVGPEVVRGAAPPRLVEHRL
jgi:hypothetical protein